MRSLTSGQSPLPPIDQKVGIELPEQLKIVLNILTNKDVGAVEHIQLVLTIVTVYNFVFYYPCKCYPWKERCILHKCGAGLTSSTEHRARAKIADCVE